MKPFSPYASRSSVSSVTGALWRSSVHDVDKAMVDGERARWTEPEGLWMEAPPDKKMKTRYVE